MCKDEDKIRLMKEENLIISKRTFHHERKGGKKQPRKKDGTPKKKILNLELADKQIPKLELGKLILNHI